LNFIRPAVSAGLFFRGDTAIVRGYTQIGRTMINLQYQAPPEALQSVVSSFYRFDYSGNALREIERADRAQFRIMLEGKGLYRFANGAEYQTYPVTVIGPTTAPFEAIASEPLAIFGWGMLPAGWAALMGAEGEYWIDKAFDARQIFGDSIMELRDQLLAIAESANQFPLGFAAAGEIYRKLDAPPFEFTALVDTWLVEHGDPDVDVLVNRSGLSPRQLERMTKRYYGMPPKKLARKYRALRAASKLAHGDSLDDTELGVAFYDQSHLIREVKQFTGLTPSQLRAGASELTKATMAGRGELGGKVSPLISES
jgi:AraC-like DNA-binding protein